jgi:hypothetical protein
MESFGKLAAWILLIPYRGFVVLTLWGWFITPIFSIREITFGEALGLSLFVSLLTSTRISKPENDPPFSYQFIYSIAFHTLALVFGFLYRIFFF